MANRTFTELSKDAWSPATSEASVENIKVGCLQRIATAVETVAQSYNALISDRDFYKRQYYLQKEDLKRCNNQIVGLKGEITKLKKRANGVQG